MQTYMDVVVQILKVYQYILLARVLMSWVPQMQNNPVGQLLYNITEPVMAPLRKILPPFGGMDFSPMILFFGIRYLIGALSAM